MKILGKQDIQAAQDQVIEQLEVPEWGGTVYVRSISGKERGLIEAAAARFKETKGKDETFVRTFTVRMAALGLCDAEGKRLFGDDEIPVLAERNAAAIARVAEVVQRLSGLTKEDIEDLAKNSAEAQPEHSPSG